MTPTSVRLSEELRGNLAVRAARANRTLSQEIVWRLERSLRQDGQERTIADPVVEAQELGAEPRGAVGSGNAGEAHVRVSESAPAKPAAPADAGKRSYGADFKDGKKK